MTADAVLPLDADAEMRILYVGGEPGAPDSPGRLLQRADGRFAVETAAGADDGLELLGDGRFDCVVSEYGIRGGNGIEFLESVRAEYPDLPFILFSGEGSGAVAGDAVSAGATDYFRREPGADQGALLANRIENAVEQYRSERADQLLDLAEQTDRLFFIFSRDWTELRFISSAYEEIWGRTVADLRADPTDFLNGVHPEDRDRVRDAMERVSGGESVGLEFRVDPAAGDQRWVRLRCVPIRNERGTVVRVAGVGEDSTADHRQRGRRERQRDTLVDLATDEAVTTGDFDRALERITETAADVLAVDRVNVWLADDDGSLTCADNYERRADRHTQGMALVPEEYPEYIEALETHRAIDADDARADPRTAELRDYLDRHDIGALLDGTLRSEGDVIGVICHEHVGERRTWTDDEIEFASDVADIVHRALRNRERAQREQALRRERQQFEQVLETSPVGITVLNADGVIERANDRAAEIFELEPSEVAGRTFDGPEWQIVDEDGEPVPSGELPFRRVIDTGEPVYSVEHGIETGSGNDRWLSINAAPLPGGDGEEHGVLAVVKDITERHYEEQTLTALHERTQAMARTEDREAIAGIAVETVDELLGVDGTVVYEFDGADRLVPLAWSATAGAAIEDPPVATKGDGLLWSAFADGEGASVDGHALGDGVPFESAFVLPVGTHGVLLTGTSESSSLSTTERDAAHLIRENLDAALDRADREQRLRERDRALQRQNDQLEQLNRLNTVIRETTAAVIQSSSRGEIERLVCERITAGEEYAFAWIGGWEAGDDRLVVSQWEGMDPEYVEYLGSDAGTTPLHEMVTTAVRDSSVQVAQRLLEQPAWKAHRRDLLNHGYRSVAVVPVTVHEHVDSVLVIHGTAPDLFDDREETVLAELGDAVGYAIQNVDRGGALHGGQQTEIELAIGDERLFSNQIAAALGVDVTFVGAVPGDGETLRAFLRFSPLPDGDVAERVAELKTVTDVQALSADGGTGLYQVSLETPQLIRRLQAGGAHLRSLSVADGTTTVTVLLTGETPVRSVVEEIRAAYPETELRARRESIEPVDTRETFRERILEEVTEKQLDALQTALYGGFYEWPRSSTREDLAATRDIASSTFSHHLRAAERKILSEVLGSGHRDLDI